MPKETSEIITVDFENKSKVEKYVESKWFCVICATVFIYDSRKDDNMKRIIIWEDPELRNKECICQKCAVKISNIVEENQWK